MTVLEILKEASSYLNCQNTLSPLFSLPTSSSFYLTGDETNITDTDALNEYHKLLSCLNSVCQRLSLSYCLLKNCEEVTASNGKINYDSLSKTVVKISKILTQNGTSVGFKEYDNFVKINANLNKVCVEYYYFHSKLSALSQEVNFKGLSCKIIVLGVVSQYCFTSGLFDDAQTWEERFLQEISESKNLQKTFIMPKRHWGI